MMLCLLYAFPLFQNFLRSIPNQAILKARWFVRPFVWVREILRETWFSKSAWKPLNLFQALLLGLLLGLCGYWNGAIVIDTLLLLFTLSLVSKQKTEFLAIAAVSLGVAFIQKDFFMGKGMGAFRPEWYFGFQSPDLTLHGVMMYYTEVFGILFPTALIGMLFMPRGSRWLTLVFFTPLIFATLVKMTPEIAANQKFVHISIILINILAASLIFRLFRSPSITTKALGLIMFLLLTITGISDALTFLNVNRQPVIYSMKDPLYLWARDHMKPKEMLLGFVNVGHPVYMAGRRIYMGWPYYGWSAGYDTNARSMIINQLYGGTDIKAVKSLLAANKIDYVMIEPAVRANKDYVLNEKLFEENFKKVFADETNRIYIYKVHSAGR